MEVNAQDLGAGDVSTVADSTPFIDQAILKAYAAGGGEVILPAVKNGYALRRLLPAPYQQTGGGIRLRKGVSLRGEGAKLLLRDNCAFITTRSPKNEPMPMVTITGDVHYGDRTLTVDTAYPAGTRALLRCGVSGIDTVEPRHHGFVTVIASDTGHITLDRPILAEMTVATTPVITRSLLILDEVIEGSRIEGFDFIGGNTEQGIDLFGARHVEIDRVSGVDPGAGLVALQFCEQINASHLDCRGSVRQNGQLSKGRVLSVASSTGIEFDTVSGQNFEGPFLFVEFYCENVLLRNVAVANTRVGRNNAHEALFFVQSSAIAIEGLQVIGNGSYMFSDGGVADRLGIKSITQLRNVAVEMTPDNYAWYGQPAVDGYFRVSHTDKWTAA